MRQWRSRFLTLGLLSSFLAAAPSARADDKPAKELVQTLQARDFWQNAGRKGVRKWTEEEAKQLRALADTSKDPSIRLRARKVLVDLSGNSRYAAGDEAIVVVAFRLLERQLDKPTVRTLCVDKGFTHYTVSQGPGGKCLLIEHVQHRGFNGGLNLLWDAKKQTIVEIKSWGDVATGSVAGVPDLLREIL